MERKIIGVDFGSSQSSIAIMEIGSTGSPELINVAGGRNGVTIPTLLALDSNDDTVIDSGINVRNHYRNEEQSAVKFASNFKRFLGKKPDNNDNDNEKNANLYSKLFIRELVECIKARYNVDTLDSKDYTTCFAYPATWTDEQINLLKEYARDAGFPYDPNDDIYAIPEPVAAMHALKVQESINFRFGNTPEHYMVIDFGGGTLDICVIKTDILGRTPQILSTSGDPRLGGKEFDEIIEHLFYRNNESIKKSELSRREIAELGEKFKEAKEAFSDNFLINEVATQAFHIARGQYPLTISKQEFSNICKDRKIYEKIKESIRDALAAANIDLTTIKKVILTGGSSKWFFLREIVAKEFSLGGDSIFLTSNPYIDVVNGCAIAIGRPDAPPEKKGIWIRYRLNDNEQWSNPKCILKPGRNVSTATEMMFIGTIQGTHYIKPYKIAISWWVGFEENNLTQSEDMAIIEIYARSNIPILGRIKAAGNGLRGRDVKQVPDEYKLYLQYKEDEAGGKKYCFEILDADASYREQIRLTSNATDLDTLPKGYCEKGDILPGYMSSRALAGIKSRKLIPLNKENK